MKQDDPMGQQEGLRGWRVIAALYVETDGAYFGLPGVDPWDEPRDARKYAGPHPVVAQPALGPLLAWQHAQAAPV